MHSLRPDNARVTQRMAILAVFVCACTHAFADLSIPIYSTGVDNSGAFLPSGATDPHYTLSYYNGITTTPVLAPAPYVAKHPAWIANTPFSEWISPSTTGNGEAGINAPAGGAYYIYTTTFSLAAFDPASVSITGEFAVDNGLTGIVLNGVTVDSYGYPGFGTYNTLINQFHLSSGFLPGLNTLQFEVENGYQEGSGTGPTGIQVYYLSSGGQALVPEASSVYGALLLLGVAGVHSLRKSKVLPLFKAPRVSV